MLPPKFEGVPIKIGGTEYIVPPLNFKRAKKVLPLLKKIGAIEVGGDLTDEALDAGTQLVHQALTRNYPDLTVEDVEDMLDMGNFLPIVQAVMGASGFAKSGEAKPGAN